MNVVRVLSVRAERCRVGTHEHGVTERTLCLFGPQLLITLGHFVEEYCARPDSDMSDLKVSNMMHVEVLMRPMYQYTVTPEWWRTTRTTLMLWATRMGVDPTPIGDVLEKLKDDRTLSYLLNLPRMREQGRKLGKEWGKKFGYAFLQNLAEPSCPMLLGCHIALFLGVRGVPKPLGSDEVEKWGTINGKLRVWGSLFH